ncbi:crossover junction endodeoxyribonuclease RuvC [Kitasatospora phosalacinea]|uniref:Crossover junction endodeoxyribonuclease RuvC n=1 Tax=Kitasatospora phosalacinea TaxID=2065 RepID=A0A9W6PLT3_9ACTN|nr:crossover junction endodeoxyribonuclease RuvC [Kitasatospora phosalacinea]
MLGVDPGLTRCGVGVVEGLPGRQLAMLGVGVVRTPAEDEIGPRLLAIEQGLESWLDRYSPELVAVERVFAQHNVRTVMGTAQASAVAVLCATRRGIPVTLHTPSEVKAAVTGSGRADKAQVTAMVTRILRLDAPPRPADAADALALAICHIWRGGTTNRLTAAIKAHGAGGSSWHGSAAGRTRGRGEPREAEDAEREDPPEQRAAAPRAAYGRVPGRSRSSPRP